MTRDEAREAVQDDASATFEKISFGTGEEAFSVSGDDLGIKVDAASAVDEAYSVGRRGNIFQHLSDASRSYLGGVSVDLDAGYDEDKARSVLEERADEFNEKPQDASFSVTDGGKVEVEEAKNGRVMDQEETLANLEGALKNMSGHVAIAEGARSRAGGLHGRGPELQAEGGYRGVPDRLPVGLEPEPQVQHEAGRQLREQHRPGTRRGVLVQRSDQVTRLQGGEDLLQRRRRHRQRWWALPGLLDAVHGGQLRGAPDRGASPALRRAPLHKARLRRDGMVRGERLGRPGYAVQEQDRRLHSHPRVGRREGLTQRPDPRPGPRARRSR